MDQVASSVLRSYRGIEVEKEEDLSSLLPKCQLSLPKARLEKNVAVQRKIERREGESVNK